MLPFAPALILAALPWSGAAVASSTGKQRSPIIILWFSAYMARNAGTGSGLLSWRESPGVGSVCVQTYSPLPLMWIMSSLIMETLSSSILASSNHYAILTIHKRPM